MTFKRIESHNRYSLVKKAGRNVVRAQSDAFASRLVRKARIDISEYPPVAGINYIRADKAKKEE
ncbi:MAG: DUF3047 domain-containing protein [Desulfarculaceae bacterium]|nr:DUF3047 domain-containing protein [Desulfarculaceae bacterium]